VHRRFWKKANAKPSRAIKTLKWRISKILRLRQICFKYLDLGVTDGIEKILFAIIFRESQQSRSPDHRLFV
jgi:hypothetical protein